MNQIVFLGLLVGCALTVFGTPIQKRGIIGGEAVSWKQLNDGSSLVFAGDKIIRIDRESGDVTILNEEEPAAKKLRKSTHGIISMAITGERTISIEKVDGNTLIKLGGGPLWRIEHPSGDKTYVGGGLLQTKIYGLDDEVTPGATERIVVELKTGKVTKEF